MYKGTKMTKVIDMKEWKIERDIDRITSRIISLAQITIDLGDVSQIAKNCNRLTDSDHPGLAKAFLETVKMKDYDFYLDGIIKDEKGILDAIDRFQKALALKKAQNAKNNSTQGDDGTPKS